MPENQPLQPEDETNPLSISEYLDLLNERLAGCKATIFGEVSNPQKSAAGHMYFSLRDPDEKSVIRCVMWASKYRACGVELKEGIEIIACGKADIYKEKGSLSFKADTIELKGEGVLRKRYQELKQRLAKEGVFAEERKRPLPKYPRNIGVITSKQGAVIHDLISNLGRFGFNIKMIDSRVEGQKAIHDLLSSVKAFQKQDIDVLVLMRGGGSFESLLAFDNEQLVREIVDFPVPVIAGIGHHKDVPLVALAADCSESTPTGVANRLNESWEQARFLVEQAQTQIFTRFDEQLSSVQVRLKTCYDIISERLEDVIAYYNKMENKITQGMESIRFSLSADRTLVENCSKLVLREFGHHIATRSKDIADLWRIICRNFRLLLKDFSGQIDNCVALVDSNDPRRQLRLGYSIIHLKDKIVKSIKHVSKGDVLDVEVSDGSINSKVQSISNQKHGQK